MVVKYCKHCSQEFPGNSSHWRIEHKHRKNPTYVCKIKANERLKEWRRNNPEKKRNQTFNFLANYRSLKGSAKKRNIKVIISREEFISFRESYKICHYCGIELGRVTGSGLDRVNSDKPYEITNIVICCKTCNYMKKDLSYNQFINHIRRISTNLSKGLKNHDP
jgi:hypothetical protein